VATRLNVIVSGGTGSGKTTTLNALSSFIDNSERILTIEDTAELQLQQTHVGRMESRPPNVEGKGAVTQRDCLRNALRMRPDRIIVGETRGEEVIDMLQAMNTGHDGSMTTIHANSARDGISRLENMVAMAGIEMPLKAVRSQIASAVNLIVQASRLQDGSRRWSRSPRSPAWRARSSPCRRSSASSARAWSPTARSSAISPAAACRSHFPTASSDVGLRPAAQHLRPVARRSRRDDHRSEPIIYAAVFIGVLLLVEALYLIAFGKSISLNSRVNRRLEMLEKGSTAAGGSGTAAQGVSQHGRSRPIPFYSLLSERR
jgi:predicted ABC-type ATPase